MYYHMSDDFGMGKSSLLSQNITYKLRKSIVCLDLLRCRVSMGFYTKYSYEGVFPSLVSVSLRRTPNIPLSTEYNSQLFNIICIGKLLLLCTLPQAQLNIVIALKDFQVQQNMQHFKCEIILSPSHSGFSIILKY